jgi:uncharacterized protein YraI
MYRSILIILMFLAWVIVTPAYRVDAQCSVRADWTNTYTIVRGDTMFRIAQRYGLTTAALAQGNCIANANTIYAGQVLRVPGLSTSTPINVRTYGPTSVHQTPSNAAAIIATLQQGFVKATGRSQDTNWIFVESGGVRGWVSSYALEIESGLINSLPVSNAQGTVDNNNGATCTQYIVSRLVVGGQGRVLPGVPNNLRQNPTAQSGLLATLAGGTTFHVIGGPVCAEGILWWQVNANGTMGWTGELQGTNYWVEPFSGNPGRQAALVLAYALNVRSGPGTYAGIITQVRRGESYDIIGQSSDGRWLQVNVKGTTGWISRSFVSIHTV